tara:strand:+ start:101 stop:700 length:600 start_codon:yes stop_codon:yes gene_type:complete
MPRYLLSVASFLLTVLSLFCANARAETVSVGPDETRFAHELSASDRTAVFVVDRLCYGSNAPTVASRHVIRFYNAALAGFVPRVDSDEPEWIGHRVAGIREAFGNAARLLPRRINLASGSDLRALAAAEVELGSRTIGNVFPPARRRPEGNSFVVQVPGPGSARSVAVRGCYREDDLKEILRLRREAAERLIAVAGGQG